ALTGDYHLGVAEVDLGFTGRMAEGHEYFGAAALPLRHGGPDNTRTAGVAMFVAEALEDALRRVPLLARGLPIIFQDLVDDGQERSQPRFGPRCPGPKAGRLLMR